MLAHLKYPDPRSSLLPPLLPPPRSSPFAFEEKAVSTRVQDAPLTLRREHIFAPAEMEGYPSLWTVVYGTSVGYLKKKRKEKILEGRQSGELSPREPKIRFYVLGNIYYFASFPLRFMRISMYVFYK